MQACKDLEVLVKAAHENFNARIAGRSPDTSPAYIRKALENINEIKPDYMTAGSSAGSKSQNVVVQAWLSMLTLLACVSPFSSERNNLQSGSPNPNIWAQFQAQSHKVTLLLGFVVGRACSKPRSVCKGLFRMSGNPNPMREIRERLAQP